MTERDEMLALADEIQEEADNISPVARTHPAGEMIAWAERLRKIALRLAPMRTGVDSAL